MRMELKAPMGIHGNGNNGNESNETVELKGNKWEVTPETQKSGENTFNLKN